MVRDLIEEEDAEVLQALTSIDVITKDDNRNGFRVELVCAHVRGAGVRLLS